MIEEKAAHTARSAGRVVQLSVPDALELLGSVAWGRIVFSQQALPAVRLVNHVLDEGDIVIRTHSGAAVLGPAAAESVVAYEADMMADEHRCGWWVVVTGMASLVTDPAARGRYEGLLEPWVGGPMEHVVRIRPDVITGYRLHGDR